MHFFDYFRYDKFLGPVTRIPLAAVRCPDGSTEHKRLGVRIMRSIRERALLGLMTLSALDPEPLLAADEQTGSDAAQVQVLQRELQTLKQHYAEEVRKLREIDARLQALTARMSGSAAVQSAPAVPPVTAPMIADNSVSAAPGASAVAQVQAEDANRPPIATRSAGASRSVEDVLLQEHAVFNQPLILEAGMTYARYDRKQLTLNGFLALDAIFLGNIAIENVESDTFTFTGSARYSLTPNLTVNVDVPVLQRWTTYQKGGAGGAAAVVAEQQVGSDAHVGDVIGGVSYRLFGETATRPDIVLNTSVSIPTGRAPYGISWRVLESQGDYIQFAVPETQPTGNGVWGASAGLSFVKTLDPAILFASIGYTHTFARHFDDLDTNPATRNPGRVDLGNAFNYGVGVAFALNERTSLSMALTHRFNGATRVRADNLGYWQGVIGSDGNAAALNLGMTYAISPKFTLVASLGVGLTPDAPDVTMGFKVPFML